MTKALLVKDLDVRQTLQDGFRARDTSDFLVPVNTALLEINKGNLVGVLRP